MKFVLAFAFTFGGAAPSGGVSDGDPWFGRDKVQHFFATAFVQSVAYSSLRAVDASHGASLTGATLASATAAVGKEIHDVRRGGEFSTRDLVWGAAGAGAATLLLDRARR